MIQRIGPCVTRSEKRDSYRYPPGVMGWNTWDRWEGTSKLTRLRITHDRSGAFRRVNALRLTSHYFRALVLLNRGSRYDSYRFSSINIHARKLFINQLCELSRVLLTSREFQFDFQNLIKIRMYNRR